MAQDGINRITLLGNLGKDSEMKGSALKFSVGCNRSWSDKNGGERKQECDWVPCVMFGERAGKLAQYLVKGTTVYVEGRFNTSKYEKDGQTRYSTEIVVSEVKLLGGKRNNAAPATAPRERSSYAKPATKAFDSFDAGPSDDVKEDDIPF